MRSTGLALSVVGPWLAMAACFAQEQGVVPPLHRSVGDSGAAPILRIDGSPAVPSGDGSLPSLPPHSIVNVDPAHGPFTGGERAIVRGTGFSSAARVWFGKVEVPEADVVPIDPGRVQVTVPPGHGGTVDVSAQNGTDASTLATLHDGYVYDVFYVDPSSGPVSGGTLITLHGDGTHWDETTKVLVDTGQCAVVSVRSPKGAPQELDCRTPPGTPGAKRVRVVEEGGYTDVLDAFTYGDSENGFIGGLSGSPLAGKLRVIVLNSSTGRGLGGATVILGSGTGAVKTADRNGVVDLTDPTLPKPLTVTIAAPCYMPTTFVDVPVDTVTAYLDPVLSPDCIPKNGGGTGVGTGGGSSAVGATVEGEIVFPSTIEFRRGPWNVPVPEIPDGSTDVRRVAYVFPLARDATQPLRLPPRGEGITPKDTGQIGYTFSTVTAVGNLTLYALAGIEDRSASPPLFTAYTLGIAPGIATTPGGDVKDVYIRMNVPLDHAMALDVTGPKPTSRGPDRVEAKITVRVGTFGYVLLPIGTQGSLLPTSAPLSFVGLPPLVKGLLGAEYVTSTVAFTGESHSPPRSVLGTFATTTESTALTLSGFMEVPSLDVPGRDGVWNGQDLSVSAAAGGPDPDLTLFEIQTGGGLSTWTVVAPRGVSTVRLPDLSAVSPGEAPVGPVSITVTRAKLDTFDYGAFRYGNLTSRSWTAYATDVFQAHH